MREFRLSAKTKFMRELTILHTCKKQFGREQRHTYQRASVRAPLCPMFQLRMDLRLMIKVVPRSVPVSMIYRGSGSKMIPREKPVSLQPLSFALHFWRFACRMGDSLEVLISLPVATGIVAILLLYRLVTRGYYEILFHSKRTLGESVFPLEASNGLVKLSRPRYDI